MQNKQYIEFKTKIKELGLDINFINWFIGFFEANGRYIFANNPSPEGVNPVSGCAARPLKGPRRCRPQFEIMLNLRDLDLLYNIRTSIGYGSIVKRLEANRKVGVYQLIDNKEGLKKIISIFNGGIRLPHKLKRFKLFVAKYNEYYSENIQVIDNLCPISTSDSWISGFTDAEGDFTVRIKKCRTSKIGFSVPTAIIWNQKNIESLEFIKEAFKIKAKVSYDKSWDGYKLGNENNQINNEIINYLNAYTLKTKKKLEFDIWCKIISTKKASGPAKRGRGSVSKKVLASQSPSGTQSPPPPLPPLCGVRGVRGQSGVALHGALVSLTEEKLDTIKLFIEKFRQKHL